MPRTYARSHGAVTREWPPAATTNGEWVVIGNLPDEPVGIGIVLMFMPRKKMFAPREEPAVMPLDYLTGWRWASTGGLNWAINLIFREVSVVLVVPGNRVKQFAECFDAALARNSV